MPIDRRAFGLDYGDEEEEIKLNPEVITRSLMDRMPNVAKQKESEEEIAKKQQDLEDAYRRMFS